MSDSIGRTVGPAFTGFSTPPGIDTPVEPKQVPGGTFGGGVSVQESFRPPSYGMVASERIQLGSSVPPPPEAMAKTAVTLGALGSSSAVNIIAISRVLNDNARESRKAMKLDRQEARDENMQALQNAADDVRSGALFTLIATEFSASASMAGGIVGIAGGAKSAAAEGRTTSMEEVQTAKVETAITSKATTTPVSEKASVTSTEAQSAKIELKLEERATTTRPRSNAFSEHEGGPNSEAAIEESATTTRPRSNAFSEHDGGPNSEAAIEESATTTRPRSNAFSEHDGGPNTEAAAEERATTTRARSNAFSEQEGGPNTEAAGRGKESSAETAADNAREANNAKIADKVQKAARQTPEKLTKSAQEDLEKAEAETDPAKADQYRTSAKSKLGQADNLREQMASRLSESRNIQQRHAMATTLLDSGGKMIAAAFAMNASMYDAKKLEDQAQASKYQARADDDTDFIQSYGNLANSVLDKLSSMLEAQAQANSAIAGNARG